MAKCFAPVLGAFLGRCQLVVHGGKRIFIDVGNLESLPAQANGRLRNSLSGKHCASQV